MPAIWLAFLVNLMGNTLRDPPGASLPACQPVDGLPKLRVTFFIVKLFRVKCLCMGRRVCRVMIYSYFAADIPLAPPSLARPSCCLQFEGQFEYETLLNF